MEADNQVQTFSRPFLEHKHYNKMEQQQQEKNKQTQLSGKKRRLRKTSWKTIKKPSPQEDEDNFKHLLIENDSTASEKSNDSSQKSSLRDSSQSISSKSSKAPTPAIEKYTPHKVIKALGSVTKARPLKTIELQYMVGMLNELILLQPAVIQYTLKTLQDKGALTNDVLYYMMRLLMKSSYKWAAKQMSVLLTTLYTLDQTKECQTMCDPRHTLKANIKDLNPYDIKFMQDTFNNDYAMTPQRFLYFIVFLEGISNQNKKESDDYIKSLKSRGVFTTKSVALIMKFMESTRNHWRAIKYEKLINIFGKLEDKHKIRENKHKFVKRPSVSYKSPKQVVHHQDTHSFCNVMAYFLNGGRLSAQKLTTVDEFLNDLGEMDDDELFEYLATLKRRLVINNDRCLYLKNLLQTHLVVKDTEKRLMLQKVLVRFMDQSKFQYSQQSYPLIRKYRLELDSKRQNHSLATLASELEAPYSKSSLKASSINTSGSSNRSTISYSRTTNLSKKSSDSRYIFSSRMSNESKSKLRRAFERLKVEIYLTKRLKYYQKIFRG